MNNDSLWTIDSPHQNTDSLPQKKVDSHSQVFAMAISRQITTEQCWCVYRDTMGNNVTHDLFVDVLCHYIATTSPLPVNMDVVRNSVSTAQPHIEVEFTAQTGHKKSHSAFQRYREEVAIKALAGRVDFETTTIPIDLRDRHSIIRELGVEFTTGSCRAEKSHIDWGRADEVFAMLGEGKIFLSEAIRAVRLVTGRTNLGLTTFKYHMRELGLKKLQISGHREYQVPQLLTKRHGFKFLSSNSRVDLSLDSIATYREYSIGELAYYHGMSVVSVVCRLQELNVSTADKRWIDYINYCNMTAIEYRVEDMMEFKADVQSECVGWVAEKYGVSKTTVRDWIKRNN
ncbi:MAG: hypothetical protein ACRC0F_07985 [Cetobacterium sp.]